MVQFPVQLTLMVYILASQCIFSTKCEPNENNLPVIFVDLERDMSPPPRGLRNGSPKNFHFFGENSILFPQFTKIKLTCAANYLIRWVSNVPAERYVLPKKYALSHDNRIGELPNNFVYESTITLRISADTVGLVACMKIGDGRNSSELLIHGENAGFAIKSLRKPASITTIRHNPNCTKDMYRYNSWRENKWEAINPAKIFSKSWPLGIVMRSEFRTLHGLKFCKKDLVMTFNYTQISDNVPTPMDSITHFINQQVPECIQGTWYYWNCSNPFHCSIVEKTSEARNLSNRQSGSRMQTCDSDPADQRVYLFAGIHDSTSMTPQHAVTPYLSYHHKYLLRISTPNRDAFSVNETSTFTCTGVSFLLSQQIVFGIKFHNKSVYYMSDFSKDEELKKGLVPVLKPHKTDANNANLFTKTVNLTLEPEIKAVICMAPRFDSEEWYNVSMDINFNSDGETTTLGVTSTIRSHANTTNSLYTHSGNANKPELVQETKGTVTRQTQTTPMSTSGAPETYPTLAPSIGTKIDVSLRNDSIPIPTLKENSEDGNNGSSKTAIGAVAVILVVLCLLGCIHGGLRYIKHSRCCRELTEEEIEEFRGGKHRVSIIRNADSLGFAAQLAPFQNEIPEADVQIDEGKLIEQDAFMSVYPATVKGKRAIVKKTFEKTTTLFFKELLKDVKVMNHLSLCSQPNIVQLLGAITPKIRKRIICVVFESSNLGNLKDFLRSNSDCCVNLAEQNNGMENEALGMCTSDGSQNQVTTLTMLRWAQQIALAMMFVQHENLVHGNLTASNILLFPGNLVKISDLSAWRKEYEREYYLARFKPPPTWRWMAIELLRSKKFTIKSDVWAFGVTLWEIFSLGEDPHPGIKWSPDFVLELEKGYRMEKPSFANQEIYQVLLRCWYRYPNDRFNFEQAKERIHDCMKRFQ